MKHFLLIALVALSATQIMFGQADRWQQRVTYKMDIDLDVKNHQFTGKQVLTYYNNSPDELNRVFYHLYFNAFQPGSMMDVRNRTLPDAHPKIADRISKLSEKEIGFHQIKSLKQNGEPVPFEVSGTILEVTLSEPILPNSSTVFEMEFSSQVPIQIRRSGRDNAEGIDYSMAQWYPKVCEYDYQGWHSNPYVGREFHGVWGDFEVNITIDSRYVIGATGYLQNGDEIGYGYQTQSGRFKGRRADKQTWKFYAPNVHDFVWGADPDYEHISYERKDGVVLHFFYQPGETTTEYWRMLPDVMDQALDYINQTYGGYPYEQYSFIQGGDGGMEYPMATLITGERTFGSLVGVSVHELMHSWYQSILATNESLYSWMDEGFTSYATAEVMNYLKKEGLIPGQVPIDNPHLNSTEGLVRWAKAGYDEPLSVHADHFDLNQAYSVAAYTKGKVFLNQLRYIIGEEDFNQALLTYYDTWKFKHPNPNDFIRIFEKQSGMELDWFKEYFLYTTKYPDYKIRAVRSAGKKKTRISLEKVGRMPMPLDIRVTYTGGKVENFTIPLRIQRGAKQADGTIGKFSVLPDWPWTHPEYSFEIDEKLAKIAKVEIDPTRRMIDMNMEDNVWESAMVDK